MRAFVEFCLPLAVVQANARTVPSSPIAFLNLVHEAFLVSLIARHPYGQAIDNQPSP
jgi:hypothetical protein